MLLDITRTCRADALWKVLCLWRVWCLELNEQKDLTPLKIEQIKLMLESFCSICWPGKEDVWEVWLHTRHDVLLHCWESLWSLTCSQCWLMQLGPEWVTFWAGHCLTRCHYHVLHLSVKVWQIPQPLQSMHLLCHRLCYELLACVLWHELFYCVLWHKLLDCALCHELLV